MKKKDDELITQLGLITKAFKGQPVQITLLATKGKITLASVDVIKSDEDDEAEDMPAYNKGMPADMPGMVKNMRNNRKLNYIG